MGEVKLLFWVEWAVASIALGCWFVSMRHRDAQRRRAERAETLLAARIEAEEQAVAKAYCEGWEQRGIFEACVREERVQLQQRKLNRMAN